MRWTAAAAHRGAGPGPQSEVPGPGGEARSVVPRRALHQRPDGAPGAVHRRRTGRRCDPFMLHIYAALAEKERRTISARTKAALSAARKRGVTLGKNGRRLALKNRETADADAEHYRPIIEELKGEGIVTLRAITAELNRRGVSSPRGRSWHVITVDRLLRRLGVDSRRRGPRKATGSRG